jgi:hypothetical protein
VTIRFLLFDDDLNTLLFGVSRQRSWARRNRPIEDVATSRHRLDYLLRFISQGAPHVPYTLHERIVGYRRIGPEDLNQFSLLDEATWVFNQVSQGTEGFGLQFDLLSAAQQAATSQIERKAVKRSYVVCNSLHGSLAFLKTAGLINAWLALTTGSPFHERGQKIQPAS